MHDVNLQAVPHLQNTLASLKVDTAFYDEYLHKIMVARCSFAFKKGEGLFEIRLWTASEKGDMVKKQLNNLK